MYVFARVRDDNAPFLLLTPNARLNSLGFADYWTLAKRLRGRKMKNCDIFRVRLDGRVIDEVVVTARFQFFRFSREFAMITPQL